MNVILAQRVLHAEARRTNLEPRVTRRSAKNAAASLLFLMLALTACGGDDEGKSERASPQAANPTSTATRSDAPPTSKAYQDGLKAGRSYVEIFGDSSDLSWCGVANEKYLVDHGYTVYDVDDPDALKLAGDFGQGCVKALLPVLLRMPLRMATCDELEAVPPIDDRYRDIRDRLKEVMAEKGCSDTRSEGGDRAAPSAEAGQCSESQAERLRTSSEMRDAVGSTPPHLTIVSCRDVTRDGLADLIMRASWGGTGDVSAAFVQTAQGWQFARVSETGLSSLTPFKGDLVASDAVYGPDDPNCCPTGGWKHEQLRWSGTDFRVVKTFRTQENFICSPASGTSETEKMQNTGLELDEMGLDGCGE